MPTKRRDLSVDKIVLVAVEMADKSGVDALSMRKLADAVGVTAMSLYNHVSSKEQLLELMLDRVMLEFETPELEGEWRGMMVRRANSMRAAYLRHRWAMPLLTSASRPTDTILRNSNAAIGCLVNAGFSYPQADWALNAIDSHVIGYTLQELNFPVTPDEFSAVAAHFLPRISPDEFPFAHRVAEMVSRGEYDGKTDFEFGLGLVLDGLEAWMRRPQ